MATVILIILYLAFIGLGIPDSLLGAAWPGIYTDFNVPSTFASFLSLCISIGTIISSFFSAKLINKFGTAKVAAISTLMTACALFGFQMPANIWWMFLFTIPLGFGAGAIDTALNNYAALNYKPAHMSFLHCFYGIGVCCSPFVMSLAMSGDGGWRDGYKYTTNFQFALAIMLLFSLPLWKRIKTNSEAVDETTKTLSYREMVKTRNVITSCLIFVCSCSMEYICGIWGATYLVQGKNYDTATAAGLITFYYAGITLGRLVSGLFAARLSRWQTIWGCIGFMGLGIMIMLLPLQPIFAIISLFLVGFGNGPIFPVMLHLTPTNFGRDVSQSIMGVQMGSAYVGIALSPFIFGFASTYMGAFMFPVFLIIFFSAMVILLKRYHSGTTNKNTIMSKVPCEKQVVTISREFGSGGRELGKRLADELGFAYYDTEVISEIASKTSLDETYIYNLIEKGYSGFTFHFGVTFNGQCNKAAMEVLMEQHDIISTIAEAGNCVIVGRGADVILADMNPFRIFVCADTASKIKRCRAKNPSDNYLSDKELKKQFLRIDAGRKALHKQLANTAWGDSKNYQLCVNTTGVTIKEIVPSVAEQIKAWFE